MVLVVLSWFGCSEPIVYEATVSDALGGKPVAGALLQFQAPEAGQPACKLMEVTTGDDGSFRIDGLCSADTSYNLTFGKGGWAFDQAVAVPVGGVAGPQALKAWPVPDESGVYKFKDGAFETVAMRTVFVKDPFRGQGDGFWYPEALPVELPKLSASEQLVFYGNDATTKYQVHQLYEAKFEVEVGPNEAEGYRMKEFSTVGGEFTDAKTFVPHPPVEADAAKIVKAEPAGKPIRYVPVGAWPAGRYALWSEADRRGVVFEVVP